MCVWEVGTSQSYRVGGAFCLLGRRGVWGTVITVASTLEPVLVDEELSFARGGGILNEGIEHVRNSVHTLVIPGGRLSCSFDRRLDYRGVLDRRGGDVFHVHSRTTEFKCIFHGGPVPSVRTSIVMVHGEFPARQRFCWRSPQAADRVVEFCIGCSHG